MARGAVGAGEVEDLRGRIEQWRRTRTKQGRMPEELWRAAAKAARSYGVSHVASELKLGYAALKAWATTAPHEHRQASAGAKAGGFLEVRGAQLLAPASSSIVVEYVAREGERLTITVPASSGLDIPELVAALRGP